MLHSTSALNYQWIISEPVGIMWVICNKQSRTSGPCVTTMRWILNTKRNPGQLSIFPGHLLALEIRNRYNWAEDEWSWWGRIVESKHCWTNATGTTTDTINTAVVPLTMSLAWHSSAVFWRWKKEQWWLNQCVVKAGQSRSSGRSPEDPAGPKAGQGSVPCFKVVSH